MIPSSNHHSEEEVDQYLRDLEIAERNMKKVLPVLEPILVATGAILITIGIWKYNQDITDFWNYLVHGFKSGLRDLFSH